MNQFMFLNQKVKPKITQRTLSFHWDPSQKSLRRPTLKTIQKQWIGISQLMKFSGKILIVNGKVFKKINFFTEKKRLIPRNKNSPASSNNKQIQMLQHLNTSSKFICLKCQFILLELSFELVTFKRRSILFGFLSLLKIKHIGLSFRIKIQNWDLFHKGMKN